MTPAHWKRLLVLARAGLKSAVERMPPHEIAECASAIAAGEGQLVVAQNQKKEAKPGDKPAGDA